MKRVNLVRLALFLFCILGVLEVAGQWGDPYATFFWYDTLMHVVGGMASGLITTAWILVIEGVSTPIDIHVHIDRPYYITMATILAFFAGIAWESFWFVYRGTHSPLPSLTHSLFALDTAIGLACDALGGFIAGCIAVFAKTKSP